MACVCTHGEKGEREIVPVRFSLGPGVNTCGGAHYSHTMDTVYWTRRYRYRIREAEQLAQVTQLTNDRAGVEPFGARVLLRSVTLPSLLTSP